MWWDKITKAASGVGGALIGLLGGAYSLYVALACAISLDYASGLIVAACGRSPKTESGGVSSEQGFIGLMKKAQILVVVLLAALLDHALGGDSKLFQTATVCYYIANEGISVLENAGLMGIPFPERIREALEMLKNRNDDVGA